MARSFEDGGTGGGTKSQDTIAKSPLYTNYLTLNEPALRFDGLRVRADIHPDQLKGAIWISMDDIGAPRAAAAAAEPRKTAANPASTTGPINAEPNKFDPADTNPPPAQKTASTDRPRGQTTREPPPPSTMTLVNTALETDFGSPEFSAVTSLAIAALRTDKSIKAEDKELPMSRLVTNGILFQIMSLQAGQKKHGKATAKDSATGIVRSLIANVENADQFPQDAQWSIRTLNALQGILRNKAAIRYIRKIQQITVNDQVVIVDGKQSLRLLEGAMRLYEEYQNPKPNPMRTLRKNRPAKGANPA
jgi:hypothetical protein